MQKRRGLHISYYEISIINRMRNLQRFYNIRLNVSLILSVLFCILLLLVVITIKLIIIYYNNHYLLAVRNALLVY